MLRHTLMALGASLTLGAILPGDADAQSGRDRAEAARRGGQTRGDVVTAERRRQEERARAQRNDRRWEDTDTDTDTDRRGKQHKNKNKNRGNANGRKQGPAFCRNGEGHPVYGMEWCREKGYNTGYGIYNRVPWYDVVLRRPRNVAQRDLSRGTLQDILGSVVLGRFERQRSHLGYSQPLVGRWVDSDAGAVLRLMAGSQPIAQIVDRNRDGRADVVLLYNGR